MIETEIVDNLSRLDELTSDWSALARSIESITPFQLPEWLITWWAHFGGGQLHIMVFRDGHKLVGVVPCFLHEWNNKRQMTLIGSGISDYLEPPIDPNYTQQVLEALQGHLAACPDWEVCDWQDLSCDTPLQNVAPGNSVDVRVGEDVPCSEVRFSGTFDEFWSGRPKDMRRNLRRYTQRALLNGELQFNTTGKADPELLDALMRLHAARWQRRGEAGMIEANGSADFLRAVSADFANCDMLRFFTIRYEGQIAALVLTFLYANKIYSYMSAFDPQFEPLGFGRNLLYESMRLCYERGYQAWNFLRGNEPYKRSWGAEPIAKCRLKLTRNTGVS
jgi:CelD/BcsL family acetyltransferase involved in cellulose biosynthesis